MPRKPVNKGLFSCIFNYIYTESGGFAANPFSEFHESEPRTWWQVFCDCRKQKSEIGNQKSVCPKARDVITLQPSSQDHDKKTILRLTCAQVSSLHTRHKEFVPSVLSGLLIAGIRCENMSVIASLGVTEEIKNIVDSGGFLRDVQQHLQAKCRQIRGISRRSVRRYCQTNGLRRFLAKKLSKTEQENAVKRASKEVHFSSLFLSPYLLVTVFIRISAQPRISAHPKVRKS